MMNISPIAERYCRFSLSFMWLLTAITSMWWQRNIGYDVLAKQNIQGMFADLCINAGSFLDALIGIWLLINYKRAFCYQFQIIVIVGYSILIAFIDPILWLHPFGPVTKNIPILCLLFILLESTRFTSGNPRNTP